MWDYYYFIGHSLIQNKLMNPSACNFYKKSTIKKTLFACNEIGTQTSNHFYLIKLFNEKVNVRENISFQFGWHWNRLS